MTLPRHELAKRGEKIAEEEEEDEKEGREEDGTMTVMMIMMRLGILWHSNTRWETSNVGKIIFRNAWDPSIAIANHIT